jgi:hypothetical protein
MGSLTERQLEIFWAFVRGDLEPRAFERWFLGEQGMEDALGEELHWDLTCSDYRDGSEVRRLRKLLKDLIHNNAQCECRLLRDRDVIPMGGDGLDERFFSTVERLANHGGRQWWLYLSRCSACEQHWLVAQEERIYDDFFVLRLSLDEAQAIIANAQWPATFQTYEEVLATGRELSRACVFFDGEAGSLVWTVEDLLDENPSITESRMSELLGITTAQVSALRKSAKSSSSRGP